MSKRVQGFCGQRGRVRCSDTFHTQDSGLEDKFYPHRHLEDDE